MSKEKEREIQKIKKKIEQRFLEKTTGQLTLKLKSGTKIVIEYMYGAKYCVSRKEKNGKLTNVEFIANSERAAEVVYQEKYRGTTKGKLMNLSNLLK